MNYFRITGYDPKHNFSFILDSNGVFEKLWQFSSVLVKNNIKVIDISSEEKFEDINIARTKNNLISIRAIAKGQPVIILYNGFRAIKIADKIYIPNKEKTL